MENVGSAVQRHIGYSSWLALRAVLLSCLRGCISVIAAGAPVPGLNQETNPSFIFIRQLFDDARAWRGLSLMPFGNSANHVSRRDSVSIARRFNAGNDGPEDPVPKGRLKSCLEGSGSGWGFNRPCGTGLCWFVPPSVETLGYGRMSLRDKPPNPFPKGIGA